MNHELLSSMTGYPVEDCKIVLNTSLILSLLEIAETGSSTNHLGSFTLEDGRLVLTSQSEYVDQILSGQITKEDFMSRLVNSGL